MDLYKDARRLLDSIITDKKRQEQILAYSEMYKDDSFGIVVNDIQEPIYIEPPSSWEEFVTHSISPSSVIKPSKPKAYPVTPTADPECREKRLASLPLFVAKDDLIYNLQGNTYRSLRKDLSFLATTVKDLQANGFYFPTEEGVTRWINFHLQVQPGCMNATSYYIDPGGLEKISDELEKKLKKWESLPLWVEEDLVPPLGADPLYYIKMAEQNGRP